MPELLHIRTAWIDHDGFPVVVAAWPEDLVQDLPDDWDGHVRDLAGRVYATTDYRDLVLRVPADAVDRLWESPTVDALLDNTPGGNLT